MTVNFMLAPLLSSWLSHAMRVVLATSGLMQIKESPALHLQ